MTIPKKQIKDRAITIHITPAEDKYLRTRKRETGLSITDVIRKEWLSATTEIFFGQRKKPSRNGHPRPSAASPVQ